MLVGLEYAGSDFDNAIIETRGLCRPEICQLHAAAPLYNYDVIIIYPGSYSHFIFGKATPHSAFEDELQRLKMEDKNYDIDVIFDKADRTAELDAAIRQGSRVIWLITPNKYVNFYGKRSLYNGYINNIVIKMLSSSTLFKKESNKLLLNPENELFIPYFNQLKIDGWALTWNSYDEDRFILATTPERYCLGCEVQTDGHKGWALTPPTSGSSINALVYSALQITNEEVEIEKYNGIFLSHTHEDKPFVNQLRDSLKQRGVQKVWVDEAEIMIGDSLIRKIQEGIEKSEYFGVVLSKRSVESSWVQQELELAMTYEIGSKSVKVLPLLYEPCNLPGFLKGKLYADFTTNELYEESLGKLLRRLAITGEMR